MTIATKGRHSCHGESANSKSILEIVVCLGGGVTVIGGGTNGTPPETGCTMRGFPTGHQADRSST